MALDTAETLQLVWGTSGERGHYLDNLCRSWSDALDNFRYDPLVAAPDEALAHAVLQPVLQAHPRLEDVDVYVAGPASCVQALEAQLVALGLPRAQLRLGTPEP